MKITEFVLTDRIKNGYTLEDLYASVSVTTGMLWWKKTERRKIFKSASSLFWKFLDTGKYTPGFQVEALADAARAQEILKG